MTDFHFLRPAWLALLLVLPILVYWLHARAVTATDWRRFIAPELLTLLQQSPAAKRNTLMWPIIGGCWLIATLAMAGPSWQKLPTPVTKSDLATVYLLDLSASMLAEDVKPSRIKRAQQKLTDAINKQPDGLQALIAYAGDAHLVAPLTDDARTLKNLVPALSPDVMPLTGSNIEMAVALAVDLLKDSRIQQGRLVLLTDGIAEAAQETLISTLTESPYALHIIGIGDESGAPIPLGNRGFAKDSSGNIVIVKNERQRLRAIAQATSGHYFDISLDDSDINFLADPVISAAPTGRQVEREFDAWRDEGIWLVWLLLPFVAYCFRRNLILVLPLLLLSTGLLPVKPVYADDNSQSATANSSPSPAVSQWDKLWLNADQRGRKALAHSQPEVAAEQFADTRWRAAAHYRANNFTQAIEALAPLTSSKDATADDFYNLGNAQANAGQIEAAIESYRRALALAPDMQDAKDNLALLEQLQDQQQNQEQQQQQDQEQQNQEQNQEQNNTSEDGSTSEQADQQSAPQSRDEKDQQSQENADSNPSNQQQDAQANNSQDQQKNNTTPSDPSTGSDATDNSASTEAAEEPANSETERDLENPYDGRAEAREQTENPQNSQPQTSAKPDALDHLSDEERQAMEQWLRQVEDDPSGLLKRKFEYQYRQRRAAIKRGEWQAPENDAHERW